MINKKRREFLKKKIKRKEKEIEDYYVKDSWATIKYEDEELRILKARIMENRLAEKNAKRGNSVQEDKL